MSRIDFQRTLRQMAQEGGYSWLRLVRIGPRDEGNRYAAEFLEFTGDGALAPTGAETQVFNLAEPPGADGQLAEGTDTVAMDVEGRWVAFVRPPAEASFPARVVSSAGSGLYVVHEQCAGPQGRLQDASDAAEVPAANLAELSLGPGAAVDAGTIVIVHIQADDQQPPQLTYFFDHPVYAKYLP